jgi:hypothetical protein
LSTDNTQYEAHVNLIETLKQIDLPDQLESARQNMHAVYPLTEGKQLMIFSKRKKDTDSNYS